LNSPARAASASGAEGSGPVAVSVMGRLRLGRSTTARTIRRVRDATLRIPCAGSICSPTSGSPARPRRKRSGGGTGALLRCEGGRGRRAGEAAEQRIDDRAQAKQILQRSQVGAGLSVDWGGHGGVEVSPLGGDQGPTSVRQDEDQLQPSVSVRLAQDGQGLPFKRMMWADDGHALREVPELGSV
jgi:hypothetical protein